MQDGTQNTDLIAIWSDDSFVANVTGPELVEIMMNHHWGSSITIFVLSADLIVLQALTFPKQFSLAYKMQSQTKSKVNDLIIREIFNWWTIHR